MNREKKRIVLAFGTRPEAIKMAPVYLAMRQHPHLSPTILLTGQHREQLDQAMAFFGLQAADDLEVMTDLPDLPLLAGRIIPAAAKALRRLEPDYLLVHGDTLSTFALAWTAFLEGLPFGHVEAGLRSHDLDQPFPEEANRRLTATLSDLDLAPTEAAKANLLREGKTPERIVVTGQTGIDAIRFAAEHGTLPPSLPPGPYVTVTLHRRENWPHLRALAEGLAALAGEFSGHTFVFPLHKNPLVREAITPVLEKIENFVLTEPLGYGSMAALLARSDLIITDSGGIQEEGAALGVPVVVVREVTERPEGLALGFLHLAGTDPVRVARVSSALLKDPALKNKLAKTPNPYGDGRAGQRIAEAVAWRLGLGTRPADWHFTPGSPV